MAFYQLKSVQLLKSDLVHIKTPNEQTNRKDHLHQIKIFTTTGGVKWGKKLRGVGWALAALPNEPPAKTPSSDKVEKTPGKKVLGWALALIVLIGAAMIGMKRGLSWKQMMTYFIIWWTGVKPLCKQKWTGVKPLWKDVGLVLSAINDATDLVGKLGKWW